MMLAKVSDLLADLVDEFGWKARLWAAVGGPCVHRKIRREEQRLARAWTYEPPTFYEHNAAAWEVSRCSSRSGTLCPYVTPRVVVSREEVPRATESAGVLTQMATARLSGG